MKRRALCSIVLGCALGACVVIPDPSADLDGMPSVDLKGAAFFPQLRYQCGPAALATLLTASGAAATPELLSPQVFIPAREGSLQLELVAAARRQGRVPLKIRGDLAALATALAAGHPVLVLQNLRFERWPRWHYAAVIGVDPQRGEVILHSGTERSLRMPAKKFLDTWKAGGHWGLVVADPAQPPPFIGGRAWLEAGNGLETTGHLDAALQSYQAATRRWPADPLAWQAYGNAAYLQGDHAAAIAAWRESRKLGVTPENTNNLALALGRSGCREQALYLLDEARSLAAYERWRPRVERTAAEVTAMPAGACRY